MKNCEDILAEAQRPLLTQHHSHTNKLSVPKMLTKQLSAVQFLVPPFTRGLEPVPVPLPSQHGQSAARADTHNEAVTLQPHSIGSYGNSNLRKGPMVLLKYVG